MNLLLGVLRRFSIRLRMQGAIAMVLALFTLVGAAALLGGRHMASLNDDFMAHSIKEIRNVSATRLALGHVRQHEKNMVIDYEEGVKVLKHREAWLKEIEALKQAFAALLEGEEDEDNPHARESMKSIDAYVTATSKVLLQIQDGAYDNARVADRMLARAKEHVAVVEQHVDAIDKIVGDEALKTKAEFEQSMQRTQVLFAGLMVLVVLLVVPLTLANSMSITQPIVAAKDLAQAISEGRLTHQVNACGNDETAELLRALDHMRLSLCTLVGAVRQSSDTLGVTSSEVASGNLDLSQRTEQAASSLQATASSMGQLTATVRQSADAASQANQLAASAATVAQRGGEVVSQVVSTMDEINASSRKIGDIIGTIDGIAFQTNILALNAAVEAARAGEQGRGFAVVAGEVRSLAQRSAEAAREIKALIGASVDRVEAGTKLVRDAGGTMDEIVASVQRVSDIIAEISAASAEQSSGIGSVNASVTQLDQMTQQNAALVEESAAAAESLKEQALQLASAMSHFDTGTHAMAPVTLRPATSPPAAVALKNPTPARPATAVATPPAPAAAPVSAGAHDDWETF